MRELPVEAERDVLAAALGLPVRDGSVIPVDVLTLIAEGESINAIRAMRQGSKLSLLAAKAIVDAVTEHLERPAR